MPSAPMFIASSGLRFGCLILFQRNRARRTAYVFRVGRDDVARSRASSRDVTR